jgi:hypothetical protein
MKHRPAPDFLDFLDGEFAWRRKELTSMWSDVKAAGPEYRSARLRAAVAMLYAHWEGFVKAASEAYVSYVAARRLKHSDLSEGFLALALRTRLRELSDTRDVTAHIAFVQFLGSELHSPARIPNLGVIKTGSNLTSKRLKSIVLTLGLDYSPFELKENLIDKQLLDLRNTIAHGKWICPKDKDFEILYQETTALLRNFKDQLANAVALNAFRRK